MDGAGGTRCVPAEDAADLNWAAESAGVLVSGEDGGVAVALAQVGEVEGNLGGSTHTRTQVMN